MRFVAVIALGVALMLPGRVDAADRTASAPPPIASAGVKAAADARADAGRAGQLVFSVRGRGTIAQKRVGDDLVLAPAPTLIRASGGLSQGLLGIDLDGGRTLVHLTPGATVRIMQASGRLVLDISAAPMVVANGIAAPGSTPGGVLPGLPASMIAVVDAPVATPTPTTTATAAQTPGRTKDGQTLAAMPERAATIAPGAATSSSPVSIEAALLPSRPDHPPQLLLPFDRSVGAAAFRRGGRLQVVFDSRKPIDLSPSAADPVFEQARLTLLPTGTLLDMPCDPAQSMSLSRVADGWLLSRGAPGTRPSIPEPRPDGLVFAMPGAGQTLTVPDPIGGGELLVGTVRADGRNVVAMGRTPGYRIVPTILGVAIERISDRVELRPLETGFRLVDPFPPNGGYREEAGSGFSRSVALPPVDRAEQWRRYKNALALSASLPAGSRRAPRLDAARYALALGFGSETRRLAEIADQDAPAAGGRSGSAFLAGAGALLSGDPDAGRLLSDPLVGNDDEAALWRNLAAGRQDPSDHAAARAIAARWRLLMSYPVPLRRQLLGDAALSLATGGDEGARALVSGLDQTTGKVGLARALVARGNDHDSRALALLDRLTGDGDPDVALSAGLEAITLRLQDRLITPADAARRTERLIYDGRMAGREREVAIRAARLWAQADNAPAALSILRQRVAGDPDGLPDLKREAGDILARAAKATTGDPLRAAELLDRNQDLLPPDADRTALLTSLADRMTARDLPGQATVFLRRAFDQSPSGPEKARLGLALSRALLRNDDVSDARSTLDAIDGSSLPPALAGQRAVLDARLLSAGGDRKAAIAALSPLRDADSIELRAAMLGDEKDWQGESEALAALLAIRQPGGPAGKPLDADTQGLVLRLAGSLSRAGRSDAVRALDRTWSAGIDDRSRRDMLALLASPDVGSVADLPRSAADLLNARSALRLLGGRGSGS